MYLNLYSNYPIASRIDTVPKGPRFSEFAKLLADVPENDPGVHLTITFATTALVSFNSKSLRIITINGLFVFLLGLTVGADAMKIKNFIYYAILFSSFILSVIFKISYIDARELWLDETHSHFLVSSPLPRMMHFIIGDVHPPLYYLLLKLWSWIFGLAPNCLRALSLLLSCFVPITAFFAAKAIFKDRWLVLLCFLLVLFSPHIFLCSVSARPYMPALLFLSIFFYCYVRILSKSKRLRIHILFSIAGACAFFCHYFILFILLPVFLHYAVYLYKDGLSVKKFAISMGLMLVLTGPWFPVVLQQWAKRNAVTDTLVAGSKNPDTLNYGHTINRSSKSYFVGRTYHYLKNSAFGTYAPNPDNRLLKWTIRSAKLLFVLFFLLALVKGDKLAVFLVMALALYVICEFMARKTLFVPRYFLFLSFFMPFFVVTAIDQMKSIKPLKYFSIAASILIVCSMVAANESIANATYCKPYTRAVEFLKHNYQDRDLIVFNCLLSEVPFDTYSELIDFKAEKTGFPISIYEWWNVQSIKGWSGPVITKHDLEKFTERLCRDNKIERIWLVTQDRVPYDPSRQLLKRMSEAFADSELRYTGPCLDRALDIGLRIYLFKQDCSVDQFMGL